MGSGWEVSELLSDCVGLLCNRVLNILEVSFVVPLVSRQRQSIHKHVSILLQQQRVVVYPVDKVLRRRVIGIGIKQQPLKVCVVLHYYSGIDVHIWVLTIVVRQKA
jgi:hypothetical protein